MLKNRCNLFVIRRVTGYIVCTVAYRNNKNGNNIGYNILGILLASIWMIAGYYTVEGLLYGNWVAPITSIPGNIAQLVVGAAAGVPVAALLKRTKLISQ